jgi:uncharacterized membrane protein affecting hemolysin expression
VKDDIIQDYKLRVIVDNIGGVVFEYRASIYDEDGELIGEAWEETPQEATITALHDAIKKATV